MNQKYGVQSLEEKRNKISEIYFLRFIRMRNVSINKETFDDSRNFIEFFSKLPLKKKRRKKKKIHNEGLPPSLEK